ncbi:hypothetical protein PG999_010606 [Apiospora kogelbergensis]|uniref:F-box domain-containing protein n=1 Tax=Apiospora kogelbergensis TaxID=1337665 RepID=A0AAW0QC62_9PEZI
MTSPKMDSLSVELKIMVLKEMDAASILSLVSASPTFHRVFYAYHNEILKHSILYSSGISTEVLNDALAAGSLPYPANMDNLAKETITDKFAAEWAVKFWKCKELFLQARFASGIKKVWESVTQPYKERLRLVKDDISKLIAIPQRIHDPPLNSRCGFMGAVLNGDPQCFIRRCCANQWGLIMGQREPPQRTNIRYSIRPAGRPLEVAMGSSTTPNYSWEHWRNRQIKHKTRPVYRSSAKEKAPHRAAEYIIATRRMCGWVFWDDSTLISLHRWRMTDFKKIDMGGFYVDKDETNPPLPLDDA